MGEILEEEQENQKNIVAAQQVLGKLESKENKGKKRTLELFLEYLDEIRDLYLQW